jgi:thioredoxin reductase (NADPH)
MEKIADDLSTMRRTPLLDEHVEAMRAIGAAKQYAKGDYLTNIGDASDRFIYIEQGEVEVVRSATSACCPAHWGQRSSWARFPS